LCTPFKAALVLLAAILPCPAPASAPWMDSSMGLLQGELTARYGPGQNLRVQRGLAQSARYWQPGDGGAGEFEAFVRAQFAGSPPALDGLFRRVTCVLERLEATRAGCRPEPPDLPVDALLPGLDPAAHLAEDGFASKLAFAVLLNFPLTTLEERLRAGPAWSERQWAEVWLAQRFAVRAPARLTRTAAPAGGPVPAGPERAFQAQDARDRTARRRLQREREAAATPERCLGLLRSFRAARALDPCAPLAPTALARSFNQDLQFPEAQARAMLEALCASPLAGRAARLLRARLGRALEPFDLYTSFLPARPGPGAPGSPLRALGFPPEPGTAPGADWRTTGRQLALDLSRAAPGGPAPACLEALACLFQTEAGARLDPAAADWATLERFWSAFAGAGAALVEGRIWHWLYEHPEGGAGDLAEALAASAGEVWNRYYAPLLGQPNCRLLAGAPGQGGLDLAARPIGQMLASQLQRALAGSALGPEFRRWAGLGRLPLELWSMRASGHPPGPEAMLEATAAALRRLGG